MRIMRSEQQYRDVEPGGVLTIGNFDGVHRGHQEILKTARQIALQRETALILMTFEPHPVAILHPEKAPKVLTPLEWKLHLLSQFVDACVVVLEDNRDLLALKAADFVDRFLMQTIRPSVIVEGEDFKFGADRCGNVKVLQDLGYKMGFEVKVVPSRQITLPTGEIQRISSTMIRSMLEAGHVADVALAQGRPFRLYGRIIPGRGKGRQIGFPTLNMETTDQILPAEGVYAGWVEIAGSCQALFSKQERLPGAFSLGRIKTFRDDHPLLIEAHVLSRHLGDRRGQWMAMDFVEYLRPQQRFSTENDLVQQITRDGQHARAVLERAVTARSG
jgi:riboflavin kinase/FMN adenylyltransferase